jgi:hypothetical protein
LEKKVQKKRKTFEKPLDGEGEKGVPYKRID